MALEKEKIYLVKLKEQHARTYGAFVLARYKQSNTFIVIGDGLNIWEKHILGVYDPLHIEAVMSELNLKKHFFPPFKHHT